MLFTHSARGHAETMACLQNDFGGISRVEFFSDSRCTKLSRSKGVLGDVVVGQSSTTGHQYDVSESDTFGMLFPDRGYCVAKSSGLILEGSSGKQVLATYGLAHRRILYPGAVATYFLTSKTKMQHAARALTGREIAFNGPREIDARFSPANALHRNLLNAINEMRTLQGEGLGALSARLNSEIILHLALLTVMPNLFEISPIITAKGSNVLVRKARDFLDSHAAEPISLFELAASLGVGLRTLQLCFKREIGCSPMQYLVDRRLMLARRMMQTTNTSATVTQIAHTCGFSNMGAFAKIYRLRFGELPSETLRQNKYRSY